jgi:hypothetical protein
MCTLLAAPENGTCPADDVGTLLARRIPPPPSEALASQILPAPDADRPTDATDPFNALIGEKLNGSPGSEMNPNTQPSSGVSAASSLAQEGMALTGYTPGSKGSVAMTATGGNATAHSTPRRLAEIFQEPAGFNANIWSASNNLGGQHGQGDQGVIAKAKRVGAERWSVFAYAFWRRQAPATRSTVLRDSRPASVKHVKALQGSRAPVRQLLQEPDVRTRTLRVPPPAGPVCSYGDPFRKPESGGCCQACKQANIRYNYFRDSDLNSSAPIPVARTHHMHVQPESLIDLIMPPPCMGAASDSPMETPSPCACARTCVFCVCGCTHVQDVRMHVFMPG